MFYGLKSSGAAWFVYLDETMHDIVYKSCKYGPDVYIKPNYNPYVSDYY